MLCLSLICSLLGNVELFLIIFSHWIIAMHVIKTDISSVVVARWWTKLTGRRSRRLRDFSRVWGLFMVCLLCWHRTHIYIIFTNVLPLKSENLVNPQWIKMNENHKTISKTETLIMLLLVVPRRQALYISVRGDLGHAILKSNIKDSS